MGDPEQRASATSRGLGSSGRQFRPTYTHTRTYPEHVLPCSCAHQPCHKLPGRAVMAPMKLASSGSAGREVDYDQTDHWETAVIQLPFSTDLREQPMIPEERHDVFPTVGSAIIKAPLHWGTPHAPLPISCLCLRLLAVSTLLSLFSHVNTTGYCVSVQKSSSISYVAKGASA